ncbi:MAG: hypothetical protein VYE73_18920 [Acidobacteriota bacterium]|nr:hypothetical protein [Acidobacteriota bacterium]
MSRTRPFLAAACTAGALALVVFPAAGLAQAAGDQWAPPHTVDGQPDLQGVWDFRTLTPLERPSNAAEVLSAEEAAKVDSDAVAASEAADAPSDPDREPLPEGGDVGAYNRFWFDSGARVVDDRRTSLIVDPPNGRLPELQDGVKVQFFGDDKPSDRPVRLRVGGVGLDGPEDRGLSERCLLGFNAGPPITPGGYNQNVQIFQSADHVAILTEMVHDTRIVPLDGRAHLDGEIRQWMGNSRGWWDGDTLVVETRNFTDKTASFGRNVVSAIGSGRNVHLVERFRRVSTDTLHYEFTVNDPKTFKSPFTAVIPMKKSGLPLFEYACHEGNYGLHNMLSGARAAEREAATGAGE